MKTDECTVIGEIQVTASSSQKAALDARQAQRHGTHAVVFDVFGQSGETPRVDLMDKNSPVQPVTLKQ